MVGMGGGRGGGSLRPGAAADDIRSAGNSSRGAGSCKILKLNLNACNCPIADGCLRSYSIKTCSDDDLASKSCKRERLHVDLISSHMY